MSQQLEPSGIRSEYPVLFGETNLTEVLAENLGEDGVGPQDLDSLVMPAGGGTTWEIPSLEGTEAAREVEGIIVSWHPRRAYWSEPPGEGEPKQPECFSDDGSIGQGEFGPGSDGNPTGRCNVCPMDEWGSGYLVSDREGDKSKACKEMRRLFLLRPGSIIPLLVTLPPTSIRPMKQYFLRLAGEGIPYYGVVTALALERDSGGGFTWSVVKPRKVKRLTPEEQSAARSFGDAMKGAQRDSDPAPVE